MSKYLEGKNRTMDELSNRFAQGDETVFEEVVNRYSHKVYELCYRILRNEEEARDMAQEVFVRVYEKRGKFGGRSALYTWIYRIATNMCLTQLKKTRIQTVPLDAVEAVLEARPGDGDPDYGDLERAVAKAMVQLPPRQRAVFSMRFFDKMSVKEIAQATGTTTGAVKANFHHAVKHLKEMLGEGGQS
ncbi:MAG: RNA polymerase sigma factor [bacterium]